MRFPKTMREDFSRKGAKRYRVSRSFLCAFAPLREKYAAREINQD